MKKLFTCLLIACLLFAGFTGSVMAEEKKEIKAYRSIMELTHFIGDGMPLEAGHTYYYDDGYGITIGARYQMNGGDYCEFALFWEDWYSFKGTIIAWDGWNHKIDWSSKHFMSVGHSHISFCDGNYSIEIDADEDCYFIWTMYYYGNEWQERPDMARGN